VKELTFSDAHLAQADLRGAHFEGADLSEAYRLARPAHWPPARTA
jgi:uncharacterized protein YjbI with pentapeptide repeats